MEEIIIPWSKCKKRVLLEPLLSGATLFDLCNRLDYDPYSDKLSEFTLQIDNEVKVKAPSVRKKKVAVSKTGDDF
jgi:hypothetical protein